jgi:YjbE family integral membrane protein
MIYTSMSELATASFWTAVLQIILANILLSGDNAVIIAMACRDLPQRQRVWGSVIGAGFAVVLRVIFAGAIVWLIQLPYLRLVGGLALIYIAAKLLVTEDPDPSDAQAAARLWRAVRIIALADIVMSFDNILAVVEIAGEHIVLIAIGLAISIPLVIAGATLISALLDRLPILVWVGTALLGWVGGETMFRDPVIIGPVTRTLGESLASRIEIASAGAGLMIAIAAGALWRRWRGGARR